MTRDEWDVIVALMTATWPHSPPEDASIDKWFADLQDLDAEQVRVAMETINLDGERYPPNSGAIRKRLVDLTADALDYGEAWKLAKAAAYKGDPDEARRWLRERSPEAQAAVEDLCSAPQLTYFTVDEGMVRAQFRDIYRTIVARGLRAVTYAALPSAGMAALERGSGPRKFNAKALTQGQRQIPESVDGDS